MKKTIPSLVALVVRLAPLAALFIALPSHALYKVVTPDGRVTYTDTPPPAASGVKVTKLGENLSVVPQPPLPAELQQVVSRYPVTLYTTKVCAPCDSARQMLRQRGIPFSEKLLITGEDGDALQRLSGSRDLPTVSIGSQVLRGLTTDTWNSYLDAAGYPRESHLPATYQYPPATPLTEPAAPVASERRSASPKPAERPPAETNSPTGIKF
ncbi:MAG TPA: glutaredoxin family protein [Albitalea sp.]|nr:glutaredoxin family protein [Albitalea sp.]